MKPNFALTFSSEGLRLLQRAPSGWLLVGAVGFDSQDLAAQMADLRAAAQRIDPAPLRTKLVIPNDQIRFMTVPSAARTEAEAEDEAARALDGATPYAVSELRFDWAMDDGQLYLAAVARDTLAEAEAFANEHGFAPVSFVAQPEPATFAGEPFFGVTKSAKSLLDNTANVTRDLQPIHVIGQADIPAPAPAPPPEPLILANEEPPAPPETKSTVLPPEPGPDAPPVTFASVRAHRAPTSAQPGAPQTKPLGTGPAAGKSDDQPAAKPPARKLNLAAPIAAPQTAPLKPAAADTPKPAPQKSARAPLGKSQKKPLREPIVIGGKPKHLGLILTAILLLFLAIMAATASLISPDGLAGLLGRDTEQVIAQQPAPTNEATAEELAEAADVEPAGDVSEGENAVAQTDPVLLPDTPAPLSPKAAEQHYITTGIWQIAPAQPAAPAAQADADLYLASVDPTVSTVDAIALPDIGVQHDHPPNERLNPVAAGTSYDFDARGLVRATPEGAISPDGVLIFAGKPPLLPPQTPTRFDNTPGTQEITRLAERRPRVRPGNLQENVEREQLGGRTRSELAALRPKLRPQTDKQKAEEDETPTAQAVALSLKPRPRPSGFSKIVKNTDRTQVETRTAAVAPSIPSSASVARQATVKNALNLRQVNLIGVYGKPSDRRALVRLSTGRYKKVKIGDRIDGGKVAAISDTELRYVKNGRNVVLKMPRG
ncbi:hypothetical protein ACSSNL_15865 [Thalassobius sp. S69A]|uniref:hypothetical protein n=1 Tax=unclassified Thalassovita TaxID=2619711 RepID=UPI000C0C934E|nr:hypothetical protein [Paracoccaceae bacterium]MBT25473.1 hypothetical protein [Paracoccaceae bacterium]